MKTNSRKNALCHPVFTVITRIALCAICLLGTLFAARATDTLFVKRPNIPILLERHDNVLLQMRLDASEGQTLNEISLNLNEELPLREIKSVKLYYAGTEARQDYGKNRFAPVTYISAHTPGKTLAANPSYSILKAETVPVSHQMTFTAEQKLFPGRNFFWISLEMKPSASLHTTVSASISQAKVNGLAIPIKDLSDKGMRQRMAVGVRHAGDDGAAAFRIPGLVTTNKGTLLAVYDVRYNSSVDLQEHIDIGLSRSTDGGRTWEKMCLPIAFGEEGGLPASQNGAGDPSILVDTQTNTIFIMAAWTHGMGNQRAWWSSYPGMGKNETAQLVIAKSTDDGQTWSAPVNLTEQVKRPEWYFLLQGPGRGITTSDGTLVFPIQYIGQDRIPNAGIMYSRDRGKTWKINNHARTNTTESQVAEVKPGVLMLNMRDNRGGSRAVYTTTDLGKTWKEHESSRTALIEPVCMASLISVKAEDNCLGKDLLIFSNPNSTSSRDKMTIKISLDGGQTWPLEHQLLLDEGESWGYSCLTMIDRETIGILYESSVAHMTFQSIPLKEICR